MNSAVLQSIQSYQDFAHEKFVELRRCSLDLEEFLKGEEQKLSSDLQSKASTLNPAAAFELYDSAAEEFAHIQEVFPMILRHSIFVQCYSTFEHLFYCLGVHLQGLLNIKIEQNDFKGKGILRTANYLTKVLEIDVPRAGAWVDILAFNEVKNLITHQSAIYETNSTQVDTLLKKWSTDISLTNISQFKFSPKFVLRVLDVFDKFFNELVESYRASAQSS